jgi:hypothetical protein
VRGTEGLVPQNCAGEVVCDWRRHYPIRGGTDNPNNDCSRGPEIITLYVQFTWVSSASQIAPRVLLTSPIPGCGKTRLMDVMWPLCLEPQSNGGILFAGLPIVTTRNLMINLPAMRYDRRGDHVDRPGR